MAKVNYTAVKRLEEKYADRLDCSIDTEGVALGEGYFVDLKDGWMLEGEEDGQSCGAYDTITELEKALKTSKFFPGNVGVND